MQQTNQNSSGATLEFVQKAWWAGKAVGTAAQSEAWAQLLLAEDIADTVRERLGHAVHAVMKARQTDRTASEMWRRIQSGLGAGGDKPLALNEVDDAQLGLLAFAAGVCDYDKLVSRVIQQYVQQVVRGRSWSLAA